MADVRANRWLPWLALVAVYVLWGSTYVGIRVAVRVVPAFLMAGLRYGLAGLVVYALARRRSTAPTLRDWALAALIGGLLLSGGNGLLSLGEQHVQAGIAALLVATVPLWLVVFARVFQGDRIALATLVGLLAGLAGVALLVTPSTSGHVPAGGSAVILLASAVWALGSLTSRASTVRVEPLLMAGMEMLAGGGLLLVIGTATGEWEHVRLAAITFHVGFAFAWLVLPGSVVGFTAYLYVLKTLPTTVVGTYAYANPIVAVALGALLLDEGVRTRTLVAGSMILASVAFTIASQRPRFARAVQGAHGDRTADSAGTM
jgi:drug/metabolite transporter (DMT)-like permease